MGQSMCKIDHVFDHELDFHNFLQMFLHGVPFVTRKFHIYNR